MMRPARRAQAQTLVVGDIHGCLEELLELLKVSGHGVVPGDKLIAVGDLVHKGPRAGDTLRFFIEGGHQSVLGNHDAHMLRALRGEAPRYPELEQTIKQSKLPEESLRAWLEERPLWLLDEQVCIVHAGLDPRFAHPSEMDAELLMNIRGWKSELEEPGSWQDPPWFKSWAKDRLPGRRIVFGHWARLGARCIERFRALDSGCCYGGRLTGYLVEEDRMLSVASRQPRLF